MSLLVPHGRPEQFAGCNARLPMLTNLLPELLQLFLQNVLQLPVSIELCNAKQEVLERLHASVCVLDLWMVLQAIAPLCLVLDGHNYTLHGLKTLSCKHKRSEWKAEADSMCG